MALIHCPDCRNEVSDRAQACPHCAYPIGKLTTLHQAVTAGDLMMVQDLLKAGVDVNAKDVTGSTALMIAANSSSFDIVEMLVQAGADTNVQRQSGRTALMDAASKGDSRIVRRLLDAGADFRLQNEAGQSALDIARKKKRKESQCLLEQAIARDEVHNIVHEVWLGDGDGDGDVDEDKSIDFAAEMQSIADRIADEIDAGIEQLHVQSEEESQKQPDELIAAMNVDVSANDFNDEELLMQGKGPAPHEVHFGTKENTGFAKTIHPRNVAIGISLIVVLFVFLAGRNTGQDGQQQPSTLQSEVVVKPQRPSNVPPAPIDMSSVQPEKGRAEGERPISVANRTGQSPAVRTAAPIANKTTTDETSKLNSLPDPANSQPTIEKSLGASQRLNYLGHRLMMQGQYNQAIVTLRQALQAYPSGSRDPVYAHALYNLGRSLRLSGNPAAAIPILEERMEINKMRAVVARELSAAKRDLNKQKGRR